MPETNPQEAAVYTVKEVAALLGRSEWTVREDAREGRIPATRIGERGTFLIPRSFVDAIVSGDAA